MSAVIDNLDLMWRGIRLTLELSAMVIVGGTLLGLLVGTGLTFGNRIVRTLLRLYVDIIRGTPLLVVIFLIFYGLPALKIELFGFRVNTNFGRTPTAMIAFGLFAGAHIGEIVRGALTAVPTGQTDAAKSIGLRFWPRLLFILLPQSIPVILPPWTNTAAELVKGTSLVALLGMSDLLFEAQKLSARTREFFWVYGAAAVIYFVICFAISRSGVLIARRYRFGVAR